jgi:hypothetical protein
MKQQRRLKDIGIEGMTARWYDNNTCVTTFHAGLYEV